MSLRHFSRCLCKRSSVSAVQFNKLSKRFVVTTNSWSHGIVAAKGGHVETVPMGEQIIITDELLRTPPKHVEVLCDRILHLNMKEIVDVIFILEDRLGSLDCGGMAGGAGKTAAPADNAPAAVQVKEVFDFKLKSYDAKSKIKIIKEIRTITGLGLKEAKEMAEKVPVVLKTGLKKEEADEFAKLIKEAGGEFELV